MAEELMAEFQEVFAGPGKHHARREISLTKEAKLFCVTTPRTIPFAYQEK
jgi:hypothetical protein